MGEKNISKGASACLTLFPQSSEISVEKATTSTEKEKKNLTNFSSGFESKNGNVQFDVVGDVNDKDVYRLHCETDFHPSRILLEKIDAPPCPQMSRHDRDAQSNLLPFRNNIYQPNVNGSPSMQFLHCLRQRQASNGDLAGEREENSCSDDTESCGKKTVWNKVRAFFNIFRRKKSQHPRHNSIGSLKLDDFKVHGFKNTKEIKMTGFSENVLKIQVEFPNLMFTSNYEMSNWGKSSSHKVSGHGRMEITLKNVKVKLSMPIIEENHEGQKEMKAISPQIEIKMSSGFLNFSSVNGNKNAYFNQHFQETFKLIEPSILDIMAKKIVDKFGLISGFFSDSL